MVVATKGELKFAKKVEKALKILGIDYNNIKELLCENDRVLKNVDTQLREAVSSVKNIEDKRNETAEEIKKQFLEQEELR